MAFVREKAVSPSGLGDIEIKIFDPAPGSGQTQRISARFQVVMDDGHVRERQVDLSDVLGAQILSQLAQVALSVRTRAQSDVIPPAQPV